MRWLIEWKSFSALRGMRLHPRSAKVEADTAIEALKAHWPGKDFEFDKDDDRYFSVATLPSAPMIVGRITAVD